MPSAPSTLLIALAALGCAGRPSPSGASASPAPAVGVPRVLFVGNSLTEGNALPAMVEALARAAGQPLTAEAVTFGGFSLEDHWNQGDARRAIGAVAFASSCCSRARRRSPSRARTCSSGPAVSGRRSAVPERVPRCTRCGPSRRARRVFGEVTESYRQAAASVDGVFLPAGEAWRAAWRRSPSLELYGSDGFHPTPRGTYLAALVIAARLLERSPVGLARDVGGAGVPSVRLSDNERALFEAAAVEAIASDAGS